MRHHDIVAIGGSAGALEVLIGLAEALPADFRASLVVALHIGAANGSRTPDLLSRRGRLPAIFARDDEPIEAGHIYVAPPDRHLLVAGDRLRLGAGPWENGSRPAIDPLFRSVALCCGSRAIGVLLSGTLSDGGSGLKAIERCGGITVVQDPEDATYGDMPRNALRLLGAAKVAPARSLGPLLVELVDKPAGTPREPPEDLRVEVEIAADGRTAVQTGHHNGTKRSLYTCPECHGTMWEIDEGEGRLTRYRCHTGHGYTADVLQAALGSDLRRALGSALRALDERVMLIRRLERDAAEGGQEANAERWRSRAAFYEGQAEEVRRVLVDNRPAEDDLWPSDDMAPVDG